MTGQSSVTSPDASTNASGDTDSARKQSGKGTGRGGVMAPSTVPINLANTRTAEDFPADNGPVSRSPWRGQLEQVHALWTEDELTDGEYIQIGAFTKEESAAQTLRRIVRNTQLVPAIECNEATPREWSFRTIAANSASELWVAIVPVESIEP